MTGLRAIVAATLRDGDVLLGDRPHQRSQRDVSRIGNRLLQGVDQLLSDGAAINLAGAARSVALSDAALARMLGFGWQQADGLAMLAATPAALRPKVARLGALFNLGIALFDRVCDRYPERAPALLGRISPELLEAQLAGRPDPPVASGDPAVDLLVALIGEFFLGSRALGGDDRDRRELARLIRAMYRGERFSADVRRDRSEPTLEVWRELRHKSSLPMATMAQLALLPPPRGDEPSGVAHDPRAAAREAARLAGDAIWIADDLADVREDWDARCWSRPLWLLARRRAAAPLDPAGAMTGLIETGIVAAEAGRLTRRLVRLRGLAGAAGAAFSRAIAATIRAWLDELPV